MVKQKEPIPRLNAKGHAERHQKGGFQKYPDDAMAECNEMVVGLERCGDIYGDYIAGDRLSSLIDTYDETGKQVCNLSTARNTFKSERR